MKPLNYLPIYVAKVTETGLGDSGLNIKAGNNFIPAEAGEIYPLFDGLMKVPAPVADEFVLVFQADASNVHRWYAPIRSSFSTLSADSANVQIESAGNIELEGAEIHLGAAASEAGVLGDTLKQWLTDLVAQIVGITVLGNLGAPTGPPINAAAINALAAQLATILSTKVKTE